MSCQRRICRSIYIYPVSLPGNGLVNTFPRERGIVGGVIFYAILIVSKESMRLVLPRSSCFRTRNFSNAVLHCKPTENADKNLSTKACNSYWLGYEVHHAHVQDFSDYSSKQYYGNHKEINNLRALRWTWRLCKGLNYRGFSIISLPITYCLRRLIYSFQFFVKVKLSL
jgi:hypothetical protein